MKPSSVLHVPPPPETYQNVTRRENEEISLFFKSEEVLEEVMTSSVSNLKTEEFTFEYDDFEMAEVELEEIAPPPLPKHLQARKRSAEELEEIVPQPVANKRPRRNKKRGRGEKNEELEDITEEVELAKPAAEVLLTDDEDTEDLNVRRSVRVWSNKIKKELVEEVLPDEIDGWKIPTDDEELEGEIEDKFDESFELEKRVPKLKSQTVGKFKRANSSGNSEGGNSSGKSSRKSSSENIHARSKDGRFVPKKKRGRGRPKRIIDTDSDDEEFNRAREEVREDLDDVIEHLGSNFEANQLDSDDERPNNVEIISIDEMKNRFISEDEEEEEISSGDQKNQLKSPSLSEDQSSITSKTDKEENSEEVGSSPTSADAETSRPKEEFQPEEVKPKMETDLQVKTEGETEESVETEVEEIETEMEAPSALKSPEMLLKSPETSETSSPTEDDTEAKASETSSGVAEEAQAIETTPEEKDEEKVSDLQDSEELQETSPEEIREPSEDVPEAGLEGEDQKIESLTADNVETEDEPAEEVEAETEVEEIEPKDETETETEAEDSLNEPLKILKEKLCSRGSPLIVLERLALIEDKRDEGEKSPCYEEKILKSVQEVSKRSLLQLNRKNKRRSSGKNKEPEVVPEVEPEAEVEPEVELEAETEAEETPSEDVEEDSKKNDEESEKSEDIEEKNDADFSGDDVPFDDEEEDEDEDDEEDERKSSRSSLSPRKSPRLVDNNSPPVRRSARERKQFRCPVPDCEKRDRPAPKIEEILRHLNVNHPIHYASLITKKHDAIFKMCSTCKFLYLHEESYESHLQYGVCKTNINFFNQYGKEKGYYVIHSMTHIR